MRQRSPATLRQTTAAAWAATLLMAVSALAAPPASAPPPKPASKPEASCPKGRVVRVKPQEQKKKLRKAATPAEAKVLLEPLGLLTDWAQDIATCHADDPPNLTLDVFRARIFSTDREDFVLQARGGVCGRNILVGAVLYPLAEADTFCAVPLPFLPGELDFYDQGTTFGFEHLTDPVRQVFKVESARAGGHTSEQSLGYWEAQQGELRSIFAITSMEGMGLIHSVSNAEVTVEGSGYPRVLQIDESSESCGSFVVMPSGATTYSSGCTQAGSSARWCYQPVNGEPGHFAYVPCPGQ